MANGGNRLRRTICDIRDRMNAQFNRLLNEDSPEEEQSLLDRFEMFRNSSGGGPIRQRRCNRVRSQKPITFKVSVLKDSSASHYRSHRDATRPFRVVVRRDMDEGQFREALRENIPDLPEDFEMCRVNGQRLVIPLQLETLSPNQIYSSNVLGRSCLYIRAKVTNTTTSAATEDGSLLADTTASSPRPSSSRPAHTTTTAPTEGSSRPAHTTTSMPMTGNSRPAHTATSTLTEGSSRPAHTTTSMPMTGNSRPAHTATSTLAEGSSRPAHTTTSIPIPGSSRPAHTTTSVPTDGSSRPAHTTTSVPTYGSSRPAHTTTSVTTYGSSRPAHTATSTLAEGSSRPAHATTSMPMPGNSRPAHTATSAPTEGSSRPAHIATSAPTEGSSRTVEDFYMESSDSDIEEVILASPVRSNSPNSHRELQDILNEFREDNLDLHTSITVIARRKNIFRSACLALSRGYFEWHKTPNVEFVGEMAADYGGPRREFFRLLMIELQENIGIFEGKPGELLFSYDQKALADKKFYTAGKLIAWSIIHNGPGIKCLNQELFLTMCGQKPSLATFDVGNLMEIDVAEKLTKVVRCSTPEELGEIKSTLGDWICDCGVPTIFTASVGDLPTIFGQLVTHYIYHRVASMIQQFIAGINSCGRLWEVVCQNATVFLPLFTNTRQKLKRNEVRDLFEILWSDSGSNKRDQEEDTVFQWECWLMSIQEEDVGISFEDLLVFVTAADSVPPLGFQGKCTINFYEQEEGIRRIPYASTCTLTLYLPRGVSEEDEFKDLMNTAIKGSLGFGKV